MVSLSSFSFSLIILASSPLSFFFSKGQRLSISVQRGKNGRWGARDARREGAESKIHIYVIR